MLNNNTINSLDKTLSYFINTGTQTFLDKNLRKRSLAIKFYRDAITNEDKIKSKKELKKCTLEKLLESVVKSHGVLTAKKMELALSCCGKSVMPSDSKYYVLKNRPQSVTLCRKVSKKLITQGLKSDCKVLVHNNEDQKIFWVESEGVFMEMDLKTMRKKRIESKSAMLFVDHIYKSNPIHQFPGDESFLIWAN